MLIWWSWGKSWFACSATAYGFLSMPRPSEMAIKRTSESRPLRKPLPRRSKPALTFRLGLEKWMLAVYRAINPLPRQINALGRRFSIGTFLDLKSLDLSLFNVPKTPKSRTGLRKTIGIISAIEKIVVIVILATQNFQALSHPLGSIQSNLLLKTTYTLSSHQSGKIKTWIKSSVIIVQKRHFAN